MEAYPLCFKYSIVKIIPHPTERCEYSSAEISCAIDILGEIIHCRGQFPIQGQCIWDYEDFRRTTAKLRHIWRPACKFICACRNVENRSCKSAYCSYSCICFRLAGIRETRPPLIMDRLEKHLAFLVAISPLPQPVREAVWAEFMPAIPDISRALHNKCSFAVPEIDSDQAQLYVTALKNYWIPLLAKLPQRNVHPIEYATKLYCTEGGYKILCNAASFFFRHLKRLAGVKCTRI
jgi:hypothetical protein